jgi:ERCC4-type nuclease
MSANNSQPVVIIDTREQLPYTFPDSWGVLCKALNSGDYSLLGHEDRFAIERKSHQDFMGCWHTDRFKRELDRLAAFKKAFLLIESTVLRLRNDPHRKANPDAVCGFLQSVPLKYGVHVLLVEDRGTANRWAIGLIDKYQRYL